MNEDVEEDMKAMGNVLRKRNYAMEKRIKEAVDMLRKPMLHLGRNFGDKSVEVQIIDCPTCGRTAKREDELIICKHCLENAEEQSSLSEAE